MPDAVGRTFRRSLSTRVVSLIASLMFGVALAARIASGEFGTGGLVILTLTAASIAGVISAWGDRVTIDARGVESRNVFLSRLAGERASFGGRRLAWSEILRLQEHRRPGSSPADLPRALFLVPVQGRRLALDALEDFDEVVRLVRAGCRAAPRAAADREPPGGEREAQ